MNAPANHDELLRQFVQQMPVAVAMFDRQMRYLAVSDRWRKECELGSRELVGRSHYEVVPDIPERWKIIHRRVLAGATEACDRDVFLRADGSTEWLQWQLQPWRTVAGEIGGLIMFTHRVTERIRCEESLRGEAERFRSVLDRATVGLALVALDGSVIDVNPALCRILGYTRAELAGLNLLRAARPDEISVDFAELRGLLEGGMESHEMERCYRHRSGGAVWTRVGLSMVRNIAGAPRHLVCQVQEIAAPQRERVEPELAAPMAAREPDGAPAVDGLAHDLAHEFNNLFTGIIGNVQLAEMDLPHGPAVRPCLRAALSACRRAGGLVARLRAIGQSAQPASSAAP